MLTNVDTAPSSVDCWALLRVARVAFIVLISFYWGKSFRQTSGVASSVESSVACPGFWRDFCDGFFPLCVELPTSLIDSIFVLQCPFSATRLAFLRILVFQMICLHSLGVSLTPSFLLGFVACDKFFWRKVQRHLNVSFYLRPINCSTCE